jgi:hypothetical protein
VKEVHEMGCLSTAWHEVVGLFIDDGSFAAAILAWLAGGAICIHLIGVPPAVEALVLASGLLLVLAENVDRTACAAANGRSES